MSQANGRTTLVLVENEVTVGHRYDFWQDVTGERYHFPNRYRSRFSPGRPFVYYRGSRRRSGERATPEYFGCGRIGEICRDPDTPADLPKRSQRWICLIEEYAPFARPVPFRLDGVALESIPENLWGVGVRVIPYDLYERIVDLGGVGNEALPWRANEVLFPISLNPVPTAFRDLFAPGRGGLNSAQGGAGSQSFRRSSRAYTIGRIAEQTAMKHLRNILPDGPAATLRWVADEGETPGWDIEYCDLPGELVGVEVKGTTGPTFLDIELTAREWAAAERLKANFRICLVASALSAQPQVAFIDNPYELYASGQLRARPLLWRIERAPSD